MNDQQLKSFLKTVECGSFSKAEESLFLSKQAIKKRIDALEEELGFNLLVRTHQGLKLTPAGKEFCKGARRIVDEIDSVTNKCREFAYHKQVIRIESPNHPRLLLENAFIDFLRRYPYIEQQMILSPSDNFVDDILNDRADVAEYTYRPDIETAGITYTKLFPLPYKCVIAPSHPLAGHKIIYPEELSGYHLNMHVKNPELMGQLNESCRNFSIETFTKNSMQDIMNVCYNGGIYISKAYFVSSMAPLLSIELKTKFVPMGVIIHRESPSAAVRDFLKVVHDMYPQKDSDDQLH